MRGHLRFAAAIHCLCLLSISGFASLVSSGEFLGIAPQDVSYYKSSVIKCKDGSKKFTNQQLNDDFCDCPDGSDEPGTSACPEGKFYCANAGHIPKTIFSSRVNDGICDCCDGSDEYGGSIKCSNTCWEAGQEAREKLKKKIATHQEGLVIRNQEIEKAKQVFAKEEAELSQLKSEEKMLKGIVEKLREQKEQIEKAEEEERRRREEEEKRLKVAERNETEQKEPSDDPQVEGTEDTQEISPMLPNQVPEDHDNPDYNDVAGDINDEAPLESEHSKVEQDGSTPKISNDLETGPKDPPDDKAVQRQGSENTEGLSKEELGRLVASRWTGEHYEEKENEVNVKEEGDEHSHIADTAGEESNDGYNSETDDNTHTYDEDDDDEFEDGSDEEDKEDHEAPVGDGAYNPEEDDKDDFSDLTPSSSPSWLEKIQHTLQRILKAFNLSKSPVDLSEASRVRKEYDDAMSKLSKIQSRISSLSEKLKHDFGKEKEFYAFYGRCFENKQNKYVYKVCPFKSSSQVEGYSTTQLGRWEKFDESYKVMVFLNGDRCWNGPDRSLKVRLRCGLKDELTDVDEPSRCEYKAILSTPVLCLEDKLKELQRKLEDLNTSQPSNHDEL